MKRVIITEFSRVGNGVDFIREGETRVLTKMPLDERKGVPFNAISRDADQFVNVSEYEHVSTGYEIGDQLV
jgi:hypothetical protein